MYQVFVSKMLSTAFKRAALFGLVGAFLMTGFVVVYANITATDLGSGNDEVKLGVKTFVNDTEVTLDNSVLGIVSTTSAAVGDSTGTAVETVVATYARRPAHAACGRCHHHARWRPRCSRARRRVPPRDPRGRRPGQARG